MEPIAVPSSERWQRLKSLFHRAWAMPVEEREAFARAEANDDPELLDELLEMLAAADGATRRLRAPLRLAAEAMTPVDAPELQPGTRFGPWAIRCLLGAGGMGQVYLGCRADGAYEREVAIKLMTTGALDGRHRVLFDHECRVLARMEHPAIAQIHDAGTDLDGRPYLVMEYIRGEPIDRWCDRHALSMRARVELLATVCEGVLHAHQKGVIHRDLKPSNVLVSDVDGQAVPKIIDFGIAMHGADDDGATESGGTPGYASPEQMGGRADVDVRTDVYSLGAVLYALVCGRAPESADDGMPMAPSRHLRALSSVECAALAAARGGSPRRLLRELGDGLDAVALKALRPDRNARYESVTALLDDLRRWLAHHPPRALPHRRLLGLRKLMQRNRLAFGAASAVAAALVAALAVASWSLGQARQEAQRAQVTADFLGSLLSSVDPAVARDLDKALMLRVLEDASVRAESELSERPDVRADVELTMATTFIALNDHARAIDHLLTVRQLARTHAGFERRDLRAMQLLGQALASAGRAAEAESVLREAIVLSRSLDGPDSEQGLDLQSRLAWALRVQGRWEEALEAGRLAYEGFARAASADNTQRIEAGARHAINLSDAGYHEEAIALMREMIALRTEAVGADHPFTLSMRNSLGVFLRRVGDHEAAERELRALLAPTARQHGEDSENALMVHFNLAVVLRTLGRHDDAGRHYHIAEAGYKALLGEAHPTTITARNGLHRWLTENGRASEVLAPQRALLETVERVAGPTHPNTAGVLHTLAEIELALGLASQARASAARALEIHGDAETRAAPLRELLDRIEAATD